MKTNKIPKMILPVPIKIYKWPRNGNLIYKINMKNIKYARQCWSKWDTSLATVRAGLYDHVSNSPDSQHCNRPRLRWLTCWNRDFLWSSTCKRKGIHSYQNTIDHILKLGSLMVLCRRNIMLRYWWRDLRPWWNWSSMSCSRLTIYKLYWQCRHA